MGVVNSVVLLFIQADVFSCVALAHEVVLKHVECDLCLDEHRLHTRLGKMCRVWVLVDGTLEASQHSAIARRARGGSQGCILR